MEIRRGYPQNVIEALNEKYAVPHISPIKSQDRMDGAYYAISLLPKRLQYVIQQHFGKYKTFDEIGVEMRLSRQRVHQLYLKALKELIFPATSIYLYNGLEGGRNLVLKATEIPLIEKEEDNKWDIFEPDYIAKLRLSKRTYNALIRNGIKTIGQLINLNKNDLMRLKTFGTKSCDEIFNIPSSLIQEYVETYQNNESLFQKIDNSSDFTDWEKETIKGTFSELDKLKRAAN